MKELSYRLGDKLKFLQATVEFVLQRNNIYDKDVYDSDDYSEYEGITFDFDEIE